ncbi:hypothetical protein F4821DRAFT_224028 [Hypoxylon rubiginosum]|uniref:Uncharacterized protein n=1 Tax=Hypoxylon rubiginosum TaxID=110542 RepID=A0ACC0DJ75_9PEZI|nr:hypothetical protein F4821DRAFT_224028 [Hypoxylon rubiginosum]
MLYVSSSVKSNNMQGSQSWTLAPPGSYPIEKAIKAGLENHVHKHNSNCGEMVAAHLCLHFNKKLDLSYPNETEALFITIGAKGGTPSESEAVLKEPCASGCNEVLKKYNLEFVKNEDQPRSLPDLKISFKRYYTYSITGGPITEGPITEGRKSQGSGGQQQHQKEGGKGDTESKGREDRNKQREGPAREYQGWRASKRGPMVGAGLRRPRHGPASERPRDNAS